MPLIHWLQLAMTEGIGPILLGRLLDATGSAEAACSAGTSVLAGIDGISRSKASLIHKSLQHAASEAKAELDRAAAKNVTIICRDDYTYPPLLRHIPDPPAVVYMRGTLEPRDLNAIAIVGSRKCSYYGREQAERFGALLAGAGFTVLSGGARGIDSSAHRGAMSPTNGRTIAVLGSGVDVAYPPENDKLFEQIAERGAVLSEYPIGTPPIAENFPRRNRIVSGMSRGVLVIEADERSGALITARQACDDHGRPVFALPGRVDNRLSIGPHKLIREGATLCTGIEDIVDGLSPLPDDVDQPVPEPFLFEASSTKPEPAPAVPIVGLSESQQAILLHLTADPTDVDALIERTSLPAHQILQDLTMLSLKGVVRRVDGQNYVKRA
jgi:DNA processing protein